MMRGLDYSAGRPPAKTVLADGFRFVVRYCGTQGRTKNITGAEYRDMISNGVAVALVYENRAGDALAGRAAGRRAARAALADARSFGWPSSRPIYFACDTDVVTEAQLAAVLDYLRGAGDELGPARVGVYGEFDVVERALDAEVARFGWQTKAWSHGKLTDRAHLIQELGQVSVGGVSCDVNTARRPDFGQWPAPGEDDDMALSAEDKQWLQATVKDAARYYAIRGAQVMVAGHGNQGYSPNEVPKGESVREQIAAVRGEMSGLAAAVAQLAAGGGLDAAQIEAAAQAGARAALAELGEKLGGEATL